MPRLEAVPGSEKPPRKKLGQWRRGGEQEAPGETEEPPLPPEERGGGGQTFGLDSLSTM